MATQSFGFLFMPSFESFLTCTVHFVNISGICFQTKYSAIDDVICNVVIYHTYVIHEWGTVVKEIMVQVYGEDFRRRVIFR